MNATVDTALRLWSLQDAPYTLIAARENAVYRVESPNGPVALRLHRAGYRTDAELRAELAWMAAVAKGGLNVPAPLPASSGQMLETVAGVQVDVLSWVNGAMLQDVMATASPAERAALYHQLGAQMARLHSISDAWQPPQGFTRCAWDRAGLLGPAPLWDRFWENPGLGKDDRDLLRSMRDKADADLAGLEAELDYGLIHADLVATNVMVERDQLTLIDFDDGGYGFRLFELATALSKQLAAPDYPALRAALCAGYHDHRPLDLHALDLMILLRSATYVGWNITRMAEENGQERNARLITSTRQLARAYLA